MSGAAFLQLQEGTSFVTNAKIVVMNIVELLAWITHRKYCMSRGLVQDVAWLTRPVFFLPELHCSAVHA